MFLWTNCKQLWQCCGKFWNYCLKNYANNSKKFKNWKKIGKVHFFPIKKYGQVECNAVMINLWKILSSELEKNFQPNLQKRLGSLFVPKMFIERNRLEIFWELFAKGRNFCAQSPKIGWFFILFSQLILLNTWTAPKPWKKVRSVW